MAKKKINLKKDAAKMPIVPTASGGITKFEKSKQVVFLAIYLVGILGGFFFLSSGITGNAIADISLNTLSLAGVGLFILGVVGSFLWFRKNSPSKLK